MSFLTNLRLAGITKGMTGTPYSDIPQGPDPLMEIINQYQNLLAQQPQINNVANSMAAPQESTLAPPLRFGGVTGQSNPGADILARSAQSARETYEKMKAPQITAGQVLAQSGIKPNEQFPTQTPGYQDDELNRRRIEANIRASDALAGSRGNQRLKVVNITDPNNPTKQISANYDEDTGQVTPIKLSGADIQPGAAAKINAAKIETDNKTAFNRKAYLDKTNESLTVIKDLMDDNDNLTSQGARAVGKSSIGNWIPTTEGYAGGKKINKLKSEQVLNLIAELKQQSKTGATGMGNMSNKDLSVIQNAASLLDTGLDEIEFQKQLKIVKDELIDIGNRLNTESEMKPVSSHSTETEFSPPPVPSGYNPDKFEAVRRRDNKGWTFERKVGK